MKKSILIITRRLNTRILRKAIIPAKAGIQGLSGCRIRSGMTNHLIAAVIILTASAFPFMVSGKDNQSYLLPISGEVKAKIVVLHNKYRTGVRVPPVKWSDTVQKSAEGWALHLAEDEGLNMVHAGSKTSYGENLSGGPGVWSTDKDAYTALESAVVSFGNEKNNYRDEPVSFDSNFFKYGHYTQVVWKTTREIGCAVAKRKDVPGYIVVCRYNPTGNMVGQKPY